MQVHTCNWLEMQLVVNRFAVCGLRFAVGGWRLAVGGWRLAVGRWSLVVGRWPNRGVRVGQLNGWG